jgi:peptide/nickel transport system permease protein
MLRLILKRVLQAIVLLFGISALSFFLIALTPGDPLADLANNPHISRDTIEAMRHRLGLDVPVHLRYGRWLSGILRGDFGVSLAYQVPVSDLIATRLLNTLILSSSALVVALVIGLPLGVLAAVRRNSLVDRLCALLATVSLSSPRIFLALLALLLAARTGWFPIGGQYSTDFDALERPFGQLIDAAHHLILPALVLGLYPLAVYLRQMRGALLETMADDYVRTARAKGLSESAVVGHHALRNALNPIIALLGGSIGSLLSGSALVETIMVWPGIGRMAVEAVLARDIYVVMAAVMIAAVMLVVGNLIADGLLSWNDPRITTER